MRTPNLPLLALSTTIAAAMSTLFLAACDSDDGDPLSIRDRAAAIFRAHPTDDVAYLERVGDPGSARWVSGTVLVGSEFLAASLGRCAIPAGTVVTASVRLTPGAFPFAVQVAGVDGAAEDCAREALSRLPLDEPVDAGEVELAFLQVVVDPSRFAAPEGSEGFYVPDDLAIVPDLRFPSGGADHLPAGAGHPVLPPPPSALYDGPDGAGTLAFDAAHVELGEEDGDSAERSADPAEVVARHLTCPGEPTLTRVTLTFSDGGLEDVATEPPIKCVEKNARKQEDWLTEMTLDGVELGDTDHATVVLDVPVGRW